MSKLTYGNDVIQEIAEPVNALDEQIQGLQDEREKLKERLAKDENNYNIKVVKKNQATQGELNMISKAIARAQAHRLELIDERGHSNYSKAKSVIDTVRKEEKHSMNEKNELIRNKINEIQELYFDIKDYDDEVQRGLVEFIQAVKPYLSKEERYNDMFPTASDMLGQSLQKLNTKTKLSNVELVSEFEYSIEGLLPPTQEISKRRKQ